MRCTHGRSAGGDAFQLEQDDDARPCDAVSRMEQTKEQPAGRCRGGMPKAAGPGRGVRDPDAWSRMPGRMVTAVTQRGRSSGNRLVTK